MVSYVASGLLQLIEALIAFSFYENVSDKRDGKVRRITIMLVDYSVMYAANLLFNYNFAINCALMVCFHFCFAYFLYKLRFSLSAFCAFIFPCLVAITELGTLDIISAVAGVGTDYFINDIYLYILLIVFSKALLLMAIKVIGEIIRRFTLNGKIDIVCVLFPASLIIVLTAFFYTAAKFELSNNAKMFFGIISILLITTVVMICIYQQRTMQKEQELNELRASQQRSEMENTYFDLLDHQNQELQVFVHDMKKHLGNLYGMADSPDELKKYINAISSDLSAADKIGKTSNKLLDLIIEKYDYLCEKENITFEKNIHISDLSFMNDVDVTAIFNNLMDNAIEASKKCERKYILLEMNRTGGMVTINVVNTCQGAPALQGHSLVSTKNDKLLHGYGFRSITKSVKKYNGDIEWYYLPERNEFSVSIIFNV